MTRLLISGVDGHALHGLHAAARFAGMVSIDCALDDVMQSVRLDSVDALVLCPHAERGRGIEAVQRLRAARLDTAVVLVGAQAPVSDVVKWMDVADDCLHGLSDPREVIAKLRAIMRRRHGQTTARTVIGPVALDAEARRACVGRSAIHLTGSEFRMLELLMLRAGRIVSRQQVLDHLYDGFDPPDQKIVDVYLCKIRRKLSEAGAPDLFIKTVWGQGLIVDREVVRPVERRMAA